MTGVKNKKIFFNNKGTTLLEIIVSIGIFAIVIVLTTSIFQSVVEGQRQAISAQHTQESIRYVMEVISKDMRQAVRSNGECSPNPNCPDVTTFDNRIFNQDSGDLDEICFKNKHGECVQYYLDGSSLMKNRDGTAASTTPDEIEISDLEFIITANTIGVLPGNRIQQIVTMKMKVEARAAKASAKIPFYIQTSVSSRFYE